MNLLDDNCPGCGWPKSADLPCRECQQREAYAVRFGCGVVIVACVGSEVAMLAFKCGPVWLHITTICVAILAAFIAATQPA